MITKVYSEPSQISKMDHFAKIVYGWKPSTTFGEHFIIDVWLCSEYITEIIIQKILKIIAGFSTWYLSSSLKFQ